MFLINLILFRFQFCKISGHWSFKCLVTFLEKLNPVPEHDILFVKYMFTPWAKGQI